jgi:hypothetical protein
MTEITPVEENGQWSVTNGASTMAGPFETHAQAWRWIDRQTGSPISRAEHVSDWIVRKEAGHA